ncbi:hypothetical protein L9F63_013931, partial [Diploptera punctata]
WRSGFVSACRDGGCDVLMLEFVVQFQLPLVQMCVDPGSYPASLDVQGVVGPCSVMLPSSSDSLASRRTRRANRLNGGGVVPSLRGPKTRANPSKEIASREGTACHSGPKLSLPHSRFFRFVFWRTRRANRLNGGGVVPSLRGPKT